MTIKFNIDERNRSVFKLNSPTIVGSYRTDCTPISNKKIKELYVRYRPTTMNRSIDLKKGIEEHLKNRRFHINNRFDNLLDWLKSNKQLLDNASNHNNNHTDNRQLKVDFVAAPGVLPFLLKCPYELNNAFQLLCEKLNGTIYIKLKKKFRKPFPGSATRGLDNNNSFNESELSNYCEQKFRELHIEKIDEDDFGESKLNKWVSFNKRDNVVINEGSNKKISEKVTFVFRNKIKKHSIVFAEEIDCFEEINPFNADEFGIVKFRLLRKPNPYQMRNNEAFYSIRKLRWWSQCVLSCVKRVVIGYWTDNYILEDVKDYSLDELRCPSIWCQNVCLNNLNQILSFIKNGFNMLDTNSISIIHNFYERELICLQSSMKVLPTFYKYSDS